jgi:hypothetical protein
MLSNEIFFAFLLHGSLHLFAYVCRRRRWWSLLRCRMLWLRRVMWLSVALARSSVGLLLILMRRIRMLSVCWLGRAVSWAHCHFS